MSLESGKRKSSKDAVKKGVLIGGFAAGTMIAGGIEGKKIGAEEMLEINAHWLTPKAVAVLKEATGATDHDIASHEHDLKQLLLDEMKRLKERGR